MFHQLIMDLLFAVFYGFAIWAIHAIVTIVVPFIKVKISTSQYSWASEIIDHAVHAFEQTVSGSGRGEEKFILVMEAVNRELGKLGIKLTEEQITILIEAAVQEINKYRIDPPEMVTYVEEDCTNEVRESDSNS